MSLSARTYWAESKLRSCGECGAKYKRANDDEVWGDIFKFRIIHAASCSWSKLMKKHRKNY